MKALLWHGANPFERQAISEWLDSLNELISDGLTQYTLDLTQPLTPAEVIERSPNGTSASTPKPPNMDPSERAELNCYRLGFMEGAQYMLGQVEKVVIPPEFK